MMTIIFMVSMTLLLSASFVGSYFWAASTGQYDDLETPALRILKDEDHRVFLNVKTNVAGAKNEKSN
jgi:cbb3-type cytochrome oxidase maturation protein